MGDGGLTRRTLLAAGAGALAGEFLRPVAALAAAGGPRVRALELGTLTAGRTLTVHLPARADLLGVGWRGAEHPALVLRLPTGAGGWSPWVSAAGHGHGPEAPTPAAAELVGDPVWAGGATRLQLRSNRRLLAVRLYLVDSGGPAAPAAAAALTLAQPALAAGPGQPPIIARAAWAQGHARPRVAPEYGAVQMAFVHHTENPNGYAAASVPAMLRAIWAFHRFVRGWDDIGYNFVVDLFGRIWEARAGGIDEAVVGAQAGGFNLYSTGVAVLGTFTSVPISTASRAALERLLAWKLSLHGVPAGGRTRVRVNPAGAAYSRFPAGARVELPHIAGHRDGDSTECPGDVLYGELPAIRRGVGALAPRPSRLTLQLVPSPQPPVAEPAPGAAAPAPATAPAAGTLSGTLTQLGAGPVAGARVLLQSRTVTRRGEAVQETTLAQALTDAAGAWSAPETFLPASGKGGLYVRALYAGEVPGAGASVSAALHLAAVPLTPAAPPAPAPTPAAPAPPPA
jgi:hypothetical protein